MQVGAYDIFSIFYWFTNQIFFKPYYITASVLNGKALMFFTGNLLDL